MLLVVGICCKSRSRRAPTAGGSSGKSWEVRSGSAKADPLIGAAIAGQALVARLDQLLARDFLQISQTFDQRHLDIRRHQLRVTMGRTQRLLDQLIDKAK